MSDIKFGIEKVSQVLNEIIPLCIKHWEEIAHFKDIPLEIDRDGYARLENLGLLRIFTAREDTKLIGYSIYIVSYNMHYKSSLQAKQDVLYIDKEKRGFGHKFILWCDEQLKKEGVQVVYHHIKAAHNWGKMIE